MSKRVLESNAVHCPICRARLPVCASGENAVVQTGVYCADCGNTLSVARTARGAWTLKYEIVARRRRLPKGPRCPRCAARLLVGPHSEDGALHTDAFCRHCRTTVSVHLATDGRWRVAFRERGSLERDGTDAGTGGGGDAGIVVVKRA